MGWNIDSSFKCLFRSSVWNETEIGSRFVFELLFSAQNQSSYYSGMLTRPQPHEAEAEATAHEAEAEATTHEAEATTHEAEAKTHLEIPIIFFISVTY